MNAVNKESGRIGLGGGRGTVIPRGGRIETAGFQRATKGASSIAKRLPGSKSVKKITTARNFYLLEGIAMFGYQDESRAGVAKIYDLRSFLYS